MSWLTIASLALSTLAICLACLSAWHAHKASKHIAEARKNLDLVRELQRGVVGAGYQPLPHGSGPVEPPPKEP